jgi:diguanylate cyclase (GGDEF)-like protein
MARIEDLLNDRLRLPSPPAIAVRILEAVKRDDGSWKAFARIIQSDPALSAKILRIANSSYYLMSNRANSIEKALPILGLNALKNIALSFVICVGMKGHRAGAFDFDFFWKRAITAAVAADLTATLVRQKTDDTFVTALLQDIGILFLFFYRPNDYLQVLDEKNTSKLPVQEIERKIFGFDHQEVGFEILKMWGLPENICIPIRYHHWRESVPDQYRVQKEILFLSDKLSSVYHGTRSADKIHEIKAILSKRFGTKDEDVDGLIDAVADKSIEIISSFELDPGDMKPFSQIIQEANEELGNLSISNVYLMIEFKQAKEKAERLAYELKEANEKLRELASRDGLTGLYNHRFFQEALDLELARAQRYGRAVALVLFDIDHFKKINDTHGHPSGDVVLANLSKAVQSLVRTNDIVARYGGEEFAIVMPETDIEGATILAERVRGVIENLEFLAKGTKIKATVSLGVTSYKPGARIVERANMVAVADKALYISKQSGRNRVTAVQITDC